MQIRYSTFCEKPPWDQEIAIGYLTLQSTQLYGIVHGFLHQYSFSPFQLLNLWCNNKYFEESLMEVRRLNTATTLNIKGSFILNERESEFYFFVLCHCSM